MCGGQGGSLSDQTVEVTGSSAEFPLFFCPSPPFSCSLCLSLFPPLGSPRSPPLPPPPAPAPAPALRPRSPRRIGQRPRQGGWGRYRGPRGCRGRRPRAPAPPRSSHARPALARTPAAAENDRRLGGRWKRIGAARPRAAAEREAQVGWRADPSAPRPPRPLRPLQLRGHQKDKAALEPSQGCLFPAAPATHLRPPPFPRLPASPRPESPHK